MVYNPKVVHNAHSQESFSPRKINLRPWWRLFLLNTNVITDTGEAAITDTYWFPYLTYINGEPEWLYSSQQLLGNNMSEAPYSFIFWRMDTSCHQEKPIQRKKKLSEPPPPPPPPHGFTFMTFWLMDTWRRKEHIWEEPGAWFNFHLGGYLAT